MKFSTRTLSLKSASALVFALLFITYAYVHQVAGANQNTRLNLLHAIFERGELTIDAYHENTVDKALHEGHYYSEKAPAIMVLATPAFLASRALLSWRGISIESPEGWWMSDWMTTAASVGLVTALGGAALFALLSQWTSRRAALVTTVALFLGATPIAYATVLHAHGAAVGLICIGLWLLARKNASDWHTILAGVCAGLAASGEFTAGTAAVALFAWSCTKGWKHAGLFVLGAIPPLLLIPAYNWATFGSPVTFGYTLSPKFGAIHRQGFMGITFPPSPLKFYFLLISPTRGLFFWTPFLLILIAGYGGLRRILSRMQTLIMVLTPVMQVILIAGFLSWGGWAIGPRYLTSILPFLALPAAIGWSKHPWLGTGLAVLSVALTGIGSMIDSMPTLEFLSPLTQVYIPAILTNTTAPSIGSALGLPGFLGLLPLAAIWSVIMCILWTFTPTTRHAR